MLTTQSVKSTSQSYVVTRDNQIYKQIYALLLQLFHFTAHDVSHPFPAQLINDTKVTFIFLEANDYFSTFLLCEQEKEHDVDIFNEVEIRVWKDKKAEAVSLKQVQLDKFEEVYKKQHGFELQDPAIKQEANQFLLRQLQWLAVSTHS